MNIIAVDPGKTTGIARWLTPPDASEETIQVFQLPWQEAMDWLLLAIPNCTEVVCEDFRISTATGKKARETSALEGIGIVKWATTKWGKPLTMQSPSDAMKFADNKKLKKLDWYKPGIEHGRDASRHLLMYVVATNRLDKRRLVS